MDPNEWNLRLMLLSICLNGNCVSVGPEYCNKLVGLFEKKKKVNVEERVGYGIPSYIGEAVFFFC